MPKDRSIRYLSYGEFKRKELFWLFYQIIDFVKSSKCVQYAPDERYKPFQDFLQQMKKKTKKDIGKMVTFIISCKQIYMKMNMTEL